MNGRNLEIISVRTHMVDGITGLEQRYLSRRFVLIVNTGFFSQAHLPGVRNHLVESDLAADVLEIGVIRIGKRVSKVDAVPATIADRFNRLNHLFA